MARYDAQLVCLNGHQITTRYHASTRFRKSFCEKCGAGTIYQCPNCGHEIEGYYYPDEPIGEYRPPSVPDFCDNCGKPYPWHQRQKELDEAPTKENDADGFQFIKQICTRFHLVARQLRKRHNGRPTLDISDEYDVQDLLHSLLCLFFDDIRPEEWTPSYAGQASRMDFLLKNESIVIEFKKTRQGLGAKEVGNELIVDIERYKSHPSCRHLVCFVYDPDSQIANQDGLENDLNRDEGELSVKVIIAPKGY